MAGKKVKVLVCDDSMLVRLQLKEALEKLGNIEVYQAGNGQEALTVYKALKPGLVFLDLIMPLMSGLECLKQIKEYDPEAVVIIISSTGTRENLKEALDLGAVDFISKPWRDEQLAQKLNKLKGEMHIV